MAVRWRSVVALAAALAAAVAAATEISQLSQDDVKQQVLATDTMWLLSFHTPECFACEDFVPQLQDVAKSVAQWGIRVGSVDCSEHARVCEEANVHTAPAFKFYAAPSQRNPYTHKQYRLAIDYTGKLEGRALERFILKNMHHFVERIKTTEQYKELYTKTKAAGKNVVVLFTERDQTSPLYKAASNAFAGRLVFAEVHSSISELVQQYDMTSFPTLGVVTTADDQLHRFDGDSKDLEGIKAFLVEFAAAADPRAATGASDQSAIPVNELESHLQKTKAAYVLAITTDGSTAGISGWDRVVKKCTGSVRAEVVLCSSGTNADNTAANELCQQLGGNKEHLLVVVPYDSHDFDKFVVHNDAEKALAGAMDSLPNRVNAITDAQVDGFFVESYQNNKVAVVIATEKEAPTSFMKDLALTVEDHAETAMLVGASPETLARLQIPRVPAIMCAFPSAARVTNPDGTVGEAVHVQVYSGPSDVAVVATFVRTLFSHSRFAQADDQPTFTASMPENTGAAGAQTFEQVTLENWDTLCPDGSSAVCAIAMVNGEEDTEAQAAVLANVMQQLGPVIRTTFKFMWTDAACLQNFADGFDVQPHKLPTVVAFSPVRLRAAQLIGAYDERNVKQFLEGVLHGSIATAPLSERPVPDAECAVQVAEEDGSEELEDVDDLLEEIRREEEAEKRRLQQELEEERKRKAQEEAERKKAEAAAATAKPKKSKKSTRKKKSSRKSNVEL